MCLEHRKKKSSGYCCQICDAGLCLEDCCELYHMTLITKVMKIIILHLHGRKILLLKFSEKVHH